MFTFHAKEQITLRKNSTEIIRLTDEFSSAFNNCNTDDITSLKTQIDKCCDIIFNTHELIGDKDVWFIFNLFNVEVFDISRVKRFLEEYEIKQIIRIVVSFKLLFDSRVNNESNINNSYKKYKMLFKGQTVLNSKSEFIELFNAINFWTINSDWQAEDKYIKFINNNNVINIVQKLKTDLRLSFYEQIKLIKNILSGTATTEEMIDDLKISKFVDVDKSEIRDIVISTKKALAISSPIDVICSIYGTQSAFYNNGIISKDDSIIECEIVFNTFLNAVISQNEPECIILGASPFFVKKWMQDRTTRNINTIFVNDEMLSFCLKAYYKNPKYVGAVRNNVEFIDTVNFKEHISARSNVLILSDTVGALSFSEIINILKGTSFGCLMSLSSDREFLVNSKYLLCNIDYFAESIVLPRGLIKAKEKRLKTLWCIYKTNSRICYNITLAPCKICGGKIKYITIDKSRKMDVSLDKLSLSEKSLRKHIDIGKIEDNDVVQRKSRTLIQFSKEIDFAYTVSFPQSEKGNARIRAYCLESSDGYISDYGNVCKSTVKTASIKENEIENWLLNIYPFSKSSKIGSEKSIRSAISEIFLKNDIDTQNLSLKTAWYINEACEDKLSVEQKELLKILMKSPVGNICFNYATFEDYANILEHNGFDSSVNSESFVVLSVILDYFCKISWLSTNVIDDALSDGYFENRKLTLIRSDIVKKTFNDVEFRKIAESTVCKISNGDLSCLGVLIRLLTGLEPNIICALTWSDYVYNKTFDFSQLYIYKQFTNNGKDTIGFEKNESYRTIPVCSYLSKILNSIYEKVRVEYPDDYMDRYILNFSGHDGKIKMKSPYMLAKKCKEEIEGLNIDANIITIPKKDGGTIETDLSKYAGDIFRSNYIYRLTKAMLSADDIRFLTGRKRATTVGQYYLDYNSDRYQFALYTKMERVLDALISKRKYKNATSKLNKSESKDFDIVSDTPVEFEITVELESIESNKTAEVTIETMYGFTSEIL